MRPLKFKNGTRRTHSLSPDARSPVALSRKRPRKKKNNPTRRNNIDPPNGAPTRGTKGALVRLIRLLLEGKLPIILYRRIARQLRNPNVSSYTRIIIHRFIEFFGIIRSQFWSARFIEVATFRPTLCAYGKLIHLYQTDSGKASSYFSGSFIG